MGSITPIAPMSPISGERPRPNGPASKTMSTTRENPKPSPREPRARYAAYALFLLALLPSAMAESIRFEVRSREALKTREQIIEAGLEYLQGTQNSDGSFGRTQKSLQTSLAVLAQLSIGITPSEPDQGPGLIKAYEWHFTHSGDDGFMGESENPHESHAVAGLMAASLLGMGPSPEANLEIARRADRAMQYSTRIQNRAIGADYFGGWTPNPRVKVNDRMVTAWQLLFLRSMSYAGRKVAKRSISRATDFVLGSQKDPENSKKKFEKEDLGGFSYDAAGLPVVSVTSAGLTVMTLYDLSERRRGLAAHWLKEHPPLWYGPNFYQTHFFGARGTLHHCRMAGNPKPFDRYFRRLFQLLKDHQNPDGSFQIPPGNAENTKVMGKTYATAMALLILNADRELLPIDMQPGGEK